MKLVLFYTDPGSGMMLLQVLLAFLASGVFYFRRFFLGLFGSHSAADDVADERGAQVTTDKETL
jgi:hypothetical protein